MVRRVMMEVSDERHLLVDSSKLGTRALSVIAAPSAFTSIITDNKADPAVCREIENKGVHVVRVEIFGNPEGQGS